jgi:competence protein ComEC
VRKSQHTDRFVLRVDRIEGGRVDEKLRRVRLSVKRGTAPAPGSFVETKASLEPPLQPLEPGSYDFARDIFFQGIAASGFVRGAVKVIAAPVPAGLLQRADAFVQNLRDTIDARIRSILPGDRGAIAAMLIDGKRDAISPNVYDALFVSGIGHVLSISGYHMAVVAGLIFFLMRAFFALIPGLADRAPIKKWAAFAALVDDAAFIHHDRRRLVGRVARPADADDAYADDRGAHRAFLRAGIDRASELSDVVRCNVGADRRLRARRGQDARQRR